VTLPFLQQDTLTLS